MGQTYSEAAGNLLGLAVGIFISVIGEDGLAGDIRQNLQENNYGLAVQNFIVAEISLLFSLGIFAVGFFVVWFILALIIVFPLALLGLDSGTLSGLIASTYFIAVLGVGVVTHAELLSNIKNTPTDSNGQTKNTTDADLNTSSTKACGNHHKVTVHVKNEDDEPVPSVPIEIQASGDNDFKDEGITNTDGSFTSQVPKEIENIKIGVGEGLLQRTGTVELEAEKDHIEGEFIYTSLWTNMRRLF